MKANHNTKDEKGNNGQVVIKERKSKVWKQITTLYKDLIHVVGLLSKNVNLKFESKSQQMVVLYLEGQRCYQRT